MNIEEKGVATLDRALAILAAFTDTQPELALAELSRRTGLYKSTLLRLLVSLQQSGLIGQHADGSYHIGASAIRLANLYQRSIRGAHLISAALTDLVRSTNENANFYVRRGEARVCIYCASSPQAIRQHTLVGDIFPLTRGAAGKVLCAFSDDFKSAAALDTVRECFVAVSHGEYIRDLSAVAVAVFGIANRCEGAIAVTGLTSRFTTQRIAQIETALLARAVDLTRALGGDCKPLEGALHKAQPKMRKQKTFKT